MNELRGEQSSLEVSGREGTKRVNESSYVTLLLLLIVNNIGANVSVFVRDRDGDTEARTSK